MEYIPSIALPRGIRNNNPGNIRLAKRPWQGQKKHQTDKSFVEFELPVFGLRALMRLLLVYSLRHGLQDIQSIINRWAPPHENATDAYIHAVCKVVGKRRHEPINLLDKKILISLCQSIVVHENGKPKAGLPHSWYADDYYDLAFSYAVKNK